MSESLNALSLATLTAPINGGSGEDLSFSSLFDQIKEARRADPDYLTQGDWQTDLKVADWDRVIDLAAEGLATQSKDLMLAAWLAEGLAHNSHFAGVAFGLRLSEQLLQLYWPALYPALEDGVELRVTRLTWLDTTLAHIIGSLPITQDAGYGLARFEEAKYVENLALQNPAAMRVALDEGKINAEIFQRSAVLTDTEHLRLKTLEIQEALAACASLQSAVNQLMGDEAPRFTTLHDTLSRAGQLVEKLLKDRGIELAPPVLVPAESLEPAPVVAVTVVSQDALRTTPLNRDEAFALLAGVALFFKQTEPHSPVPHLVERAIKWGNMPLEEWLQDVIKDSSVVDGIRDVLGTKAP